ncbi:MAG: hypothetical protein U0T75_12645 [Chitinophagales bacterium]
MKQTLNGIANRFKLVNRIKLLLLSFLCLSYAAKAGDTTELARLDKPAVAFITYYDDSLGNDVFYWELKRGKKTKHLPAYNFDGIERAQTATLQAIQLNGKGMPEIIVQWTFEAHHNYGGQPELGEGGIAGGWAYGFTMVDVWDLDADSILFTAITNYAQENSETEGVRKDSLAENDAKEDTIDLVTHQTNCSWQYEVTFNTDRSITLSMPVADGYEIISLNDVEESRTPMECTPDHLGGTFVLRRGVYVPKP